MAKQRALVCPPAWRARPGAPRQVGIRGQLALALVWPEGSRHSLLAAWKEALPLVAQLEHSLDNSPRLQRAQCRTMRKLSAAVAWRRIPASTPLQAACSEELRLAVW